MPDFAQRRTTMVDTQVRTNDVTRYPVIAAMLHVPRECFVPEARREVAYKGENLDLAPGRVLLEPRTFAKMIDALDLRTTDLVLDLGCGLGYSAAVLARMAQAVVAVEPDPAMAAEAERRLAAQGVDNAAVVHADLVTLTEELLSSNTWAGDGIRSIEHWLQVFVGLSPANAAAVR